MKMLLNCWNRWNLNWQLMPAVHQTLDLKQLHPVDWLLSLKFSGAGVRTPVEPVEGADLFLGPALAFMPDLGLALLLDLLFTSWGS